MKYLLSVPGSFAEYSGARTLLAKAAALSSTTAEERFFCCSDPLQRPLGSGGGTAHLLQQCYEQERASLGEVSFGAWLQRDVRVLIHAGGQSRRLPGYATTGKSMVPLPARSLVRGQSVDQTLLSLQVPFLADAVRTAPAHLHTVVACGDVLLQPHRALPSLRHMRAGDVDVLCYGLSRDEAALSRHGVFFLRDESPGVLGFMLQKPSAATVREHLRRHHTCLMDTGLWLLSDRAVEHLRVRARAPAASNTAAVTETPGHQWRAYDLYAQFGCSLGPAATCPDAELSELKVRVVNLTGSSFYHYGTTAELLSSTAQLEGSPPPRDGLLSTSPASLRSSSLVASGAAAAAAGACGCYGSAARPALVSSPTVVVQNSVVEAVLADNCEQVWVEGSHVAPGWLLHGCNVITGVPTNDWRLQVPHGVCISVVPVSSDRLYQHSTRLPQSRHAGEGHRGRRLWVARPYGYEDTFTGIVGGTAASAECAILHQPLRTWLSERGVDETDVMPLGVGDAEEEGCCDIYRARLYPCCASVEELGLMLRWMITPPTPELKREPWWQLARSTWHHASDDLPRLSAESLNRVADIAAVVEQRDHFQKSLLPRMAESHEQSGFYLSDLSAAAEKFVQWGLPLPAAPPPLSLPGCVAASAVVKCQPTWPSQGLALEAMHMNMFHARVHQLLLRASLSPKRDSDGNDDGDHAAAAAMYDQRAFDVLRSAMVTYSLTSRLQSPRSSVLEDQIVWARCPARIDLAGGWTDTPPYSVLYGGSVINVAVELNGQPPIQAYVRLREEPEIMIRSIDLGVEALLRSFEDIRSFDQLGSAFSVAKAALALAGFVPEFCAEHYDSLQDQLTRTFAGRGMEITLFVAIPAGSGLGTSSIVAGTVLHALSDFCGLGWDTSATCRRVLVLEQLLTAGGGWQDQNGGLFSGVKLVRSLPGLRQHPDVRWLPDRLFTGPAHSRCHLLYYTGITRTAKDILADIVRGMFLNDARRLNVLHAMHDHVSRMYDAITGGDFTVYGALIAESWEQNQALDAGTCPAEVRAIMRRVQPYILGGKLAGAGGGGYLYMVARDEDCARRVREVLIANPPNHKARFVDMQLSFVGLQVSRS